MKLFRNIVNDSSVKYITHMGDDLLVVNAARVSMDKFKEEFGDGDSRLIKYLARENHFTPFTHPQITLLEEVPIAVARQRFKHTVGFSYNEVSRRYVSTEPSIFIPDVWRSKPEGNIKQGSGAPLEDSLQESVRASVISLVDKALTTYDNLLDAGVAPEQARFVLPQNMMTQYYVTGSLAAFARSYMLRIEGTTQEETQDLSRKWDKIIRPLFPESWSALVD